MRTLVWFRGKDLRVADHAPLLDAAKAGEVVPLFVVDPYFFAKARARTMPHRLQFLRENLAALAKNLEHLGSRLVLVAGKSHEVVPRVAAAWKVDRVVAHRWTEPVGRARDAKVAGLLDVPFVLYEGELLAPPGTVRTGTGDAFKVFTPFARAFVKEVTVEVPLPAPKALPPVPRRSPGTDVTEVPVPTLDDLGLVENPGIVRGGERAARERLAAFLDGPAARYHLGRNRMDVAGTSRLSQDLKFGTLSVRAVWHASGEALAKHPEALRTFRNELLWREFAYVLLSEWPELLERPFRRAFEGFPWKKDARGWEAWTTGTTGYPVVDAAARQLLGEGFVHNRARMIAASFLAKHQLIDFRDGEAHYLTWLTDGDWAVNDAGWQWSAGCGADAQPYFRVFNPVSQGKEHDPDGAYVRRWVPELRELPTKYVHAPWEAPAEVLRGAGVVLGGGERATYPRPVVDHAEARSRFLALAKAHL